MTYAQRQDGVWRELRQTFPVVAADGRQASWETFTKLSVSEQESLGGVLVPEPTAPEGKVETGRFLKPTGDTPAWDVTYVDAPAPATSTAPDNPTLSDWRVALTLWGRIDDVTARVNALVASTDPQMIVLGKVAKERLEYANNVLREQLLALKGLFNFTEADIEESLWRAGQVAKGDLSGVWPLPASGA